MSNESDAFFEVIDLEADDLGEFDALAVCRDPIDATTPQVGGTGTADPDQQMEAVRETFRRVAQEFDRGVTAIFAEVAERLVELARIEPSDGVLDVGTGTGSALVRALSRTRGRGVGVDAVPEMLRHADRALADAKLADRAELRAMAMEQLEFPDDSFEVVLSAQALPFSARPREALGEMTRVTKPGGRVALANKGLWDRAWAWDVELLARYDAATPLVRESLSTEDELREAADEAGLRTAHIETVEHRLRFTSVEQYWAYVRSTGLRAALDRLSPEQLREYTQEANRHLQRMAEGDGIVQAYPVAYFVGVAEKSARPSRQRPRPPGEARRLPGVIRRLLGRLRP